ncbi:uncharacterized protein LODBEIA_P23890 [Lodderomyces beijingensis]|uniref:Transcriptional coactivator HFI1/ADA1 n=1 Tax=Lodderomyces beijingensis TaxID=1775926 RepID=A0ABP0ZLT6_9ASCO
MSTKAATTTSQTLTTAPTSNGKSVNSVNNNTTANATTTATTSSVAPALQAQKGKSGKRLELEKLIRDFQSKLGKNWEKYHETLSLFLVGKLSRAELVSTITPLLKEHNLFQYHNKLLMLNFANSLKDSGPLEFNNEFASFWNKKLSKSTKNVKSSQYEKFKQNIMGLPIKERRRIKNIMRDSGKRNKLNAGITLTRHTLLPKIPMIQDKEQQQLQVNNLVQWQQDVLNGMNTPIATESFEIPDADNLTKIMLMIMREHGLTGGLNPGVLEVLLLGLKSHMKNIVETAIDVAKYRENKYTNNDFVSYQNQLNGNGNSVRNGSGSKNDSSPRKRKLDEEEEEEGEKEEAKEEGGGGNGVVPGKPKGSKDIILSVEDLYDMFEMFPHIIEPGGPKLRLANVLLENDDCHRSKDDLEYTLPPKPTSLLSLANNDGKKVATSGPLSRIPTGVGNSATTNNVNTNVNVNTNANANATAATVSAATSNTSDNAAAKLENGAARSASVVDPLQPMPTAQQQPTAAPQQPMSRPQAHPMPRHDAHIGSTDELKWVLHDLISTM